MTSTATLEDRVRAALAPHLLVVRGIGTGGMGAVECVDLIITGSFGCFKG